jgi:hypothetical protein
MANVKPFTDNAADRQSPTIGDSDTLLCGNAIDASTATTLTIGATNATDIVVVADIEFQGTTTFPGPVEPVNLVAEFEIDSVATSANVTAANLNTLTGGGATTLHTHAVAGGVPLEFTVNSVATSTNVTAANLNSLTAGTFAGMVQKRVLAIGHADLTDADGSQTLNIGTALPTNAMILGVSIALATSFTGGGAGIVTVNIGSAGDPDAIVANADLFAAAVDGVASTFSDGIAPRKIFALATQLTATVDADVDVADLTAGAATITVAFIVLP